MESGAETRDALPAGAAFPQLDQALPGNRRVCSLEAVVLRAATMGPMGRYYAFVHIASPPLR